MFAETVDVVVVGTGGAGFATALGAADEGLSALMIESTDRWGGSTAMSGGGMWLPNNPLMRRDGLGDSREEALEYMRATIGDVGAATSPARMEAFVDGVEDFVLTAQKHGMAFARATDYPDYYPELPGGKVGRALEAAPISGRTLGPWYKSLRLLMPLPIKTDDVWLLARSWSTPAGFTRGAKVVFRILGSVVTGQKRIGIGAGLAAHFGRAVLVQGKVPLWLSSSVEGLIVEDGRVVGVEVLREGRTVRVRARRGVMLGAGGFDHNTAWRQEYQGVDGHPSGNPGNRGRPLELAMEAGAATELMDEAWWGASIAPAGENGEPSFLVGERALPYSIIVDSQGERFANEAESYVDLGHHMLEHDRDGTYWFIIESRHARRYLRTFALDPRANKAMDAAGVRVEARTIAELVTRLGLDAATFRRTIDRFNGFARSGRDQDFARGDSAYDRYYGDPTVHPNASLGPIERGPFIAYKLVVGDLGTKGGVVTDEHARALREDGSVIEGLYSAGNNSASVMGRTYPGPGSSIAPAVVFGLRAARHMAASGRA